MVNNKFYCCPECPKVDLSDLQQKIGDLQQNIGDVFKKNGIPSFGNRQAMQQDSSTSESQIKYNTENMGKDANIIFLLYEQKKKYTDDELNQYKQNAEAARLNYKGKDIFGDRKIAGVNYIKKDVSGTCENPLVKDCDLKGCQITDCPYPEKGFTFSQSR